MFVCFVCVSMSKRAFMFVCVFPHPWMASSAWSAWSTCPPQPPCFPPSLWKQVRLCVEVCVSSSRVSAARTHTHTLPRPLSSSHPLLLSLHLLSQWLLQAETLLPSSPLSSFHTPSCGAPPLFLSLTLAPFLPKLLHSLPPLPPSFPPCSLFFIRGCSCPPSFHFSPSLSHHLSTSHPHSEARAQEEHQWFSMKSPGCWFTKLWINISIPIDLSMITPHESLWTKQQTCPVTSAHLKASVSFYRRTNMQIDTCSNTDWRGKYESRSEGETRECDGNYEEPCALLPQHCDLFTKRPL